MKNVCAAITRHLRRIDLGYLAACMACSLFSTMVLVSLGIYQLGSYDKARTQLMAAVLGVGLALAVSALDYRVLLRFWPVHAAVTWGLVLPTLFLHNFRLGPLLIGYDAGGTSNYSWYKLGDLTFQPSELAKLSFLITFAIHLNRAQGKINHPRVLIGLLAHLLAPVLVIHLQGDDGTALIFLCIGCAMLFSAGLSWKYILGAAAFGSGALAVLLGKKLLKSYQIARIMAVLEPDNPAYEAYSYQQNKAAISIGAGQIFGRGLFRGPHNLVPNAWNDFIFSYICESLGFVGAVAVLAVLTTITVKTLRIGLHCTDHTAACVCTGVFSVLLFQTVVNVGMNLQLLPVIGVTLPFLSAGGSSTVMLYLSIGMILSLQRYQRPGAFLPDREDGRA